MSDSDTNGFLQRLSHDMADAVEAASASVVTVSGGRRYPGSGTVYSASDSEVLVLSAVHTVGDGEGLGVADRAAELVGYDHRSGLALLRVDDAKGLSLEAAKPSEARVRVGQFALSVGRSRGEVRAGFGIVNSLRVGQRRRGGRGSGRGSGHFGVGIAPYFGLGGGAVVSAGGELLGVAVSGSREATFALPAGTAWEVAARLKSGGTMRRGYLGIYSQPVRLPAPGSLGMTQENGLLIAGVTDGSPASEAGIMVGDIIVTLDGQPVRDTDDLMTLLTGERVGKSVPVNLVRGGVLTELFVIVGERTSDGCGTGG